MPVHVGVVQATGAQAPLTQPAPAQVLPRQTPPCHAVPAAEAAAQVRASQGMPKTSCSPLSSPPVIGSAMWLPPREASIEPVPVERAAVCAYPGTEPFSSSSTAPLTSRTPAPCTGWCPASACRRWP